MKFEGLFSLKNKKKIFECCLLQILLGTLRLNKCNLCFVKKLEKKKILSNKNVITKGNLKLERK